MPVTELRISAPAPPEEPPPYRFPVLGTIAPVVASLAIWALTGSGFALIFAALGPVTALASLADARVGARRLSRREARRYAADMASTLARLHDLHRAEAAGLAETYPSATVVAESAGADPARWRLTRGHPVRVRLGLGRVASAVEFDASSVVLRDERVDDLRSRARSIESAPVTIDVSLGVGIVGRGELARALARSILVQAARLVSPDEHRVRVGDSATTEIGWIEALPHALGAPARHPAVFADIVAKDDASCVLIAISASAETLPSECRVIVTVDGSGGVVAQHPDSASKGAFVPEIVSRVSANDWAQRVRVEAERDGLAPSSSLVPMSVDLAPLLQIEPGPAGDSLAAVIGIAASGPLIVDLVGDGPHAIVGGTTGSGKSELLTSWIVSMAWARSPRDVNFLLIDFKGGSAFTPLAALPHTVGIVTDLDPVEAARALASLSAELRYRERALALARAREVSELPELPRLVIVVDEFAAMISDHPDLHALFVDLAARGRSLGVHLVLCTQRPAGVVRDGVLANVDARISLRVNNRADSIAVLGDDLAATIPASSKGRGAVARGGGAAELVQFALAATSDIERVRERWGESGPLRRPWCAPLPSVVEASDVPVGAFGLLDLPHEQRRGPAVWDPVGDGTLLVLGANASGKSVALEAVGATAGQVWRVPRDVPGAWDCIEHLDSNLHPSPDAAPTPPICVVIDDVDALLPRFSLEHRTVVIERLIRLIREADSSRLRVAMSARRMTAELQSIAALAPARLLLSHASRQDWVSAGGEGSHYPGRLPQGGGVWQGHRVQVTLVPVPVHGSQHDISDVPPDRPLAIVAGNPAALRSELERSFRVLSPSDASLSPLERGVALIGDVEEWQSRWGALSSLAGRAHVLFVGCSTAEFRALTRSRWVPPPLSAQPGSAWLLGDDGSVSRARLPGYGGTSAGW